jgi:F-type H+-transporting ATPase subunit delta
MALSQPTAISISYARALIELATAQHQAQQVGEEIAAIRQVLDSDPSFGAFLSDPAIGRSVRSASLDRIFAGSASQLVMNFLRVLDRNGRLDHLSEIAAAFADLLDEQLGNVEIELTVAQQLNVDELERVRQQIGAALNRNAIVHQTVDDAIIGGMIVRVKDRMIDASVRYQLKAMKEKLLAAAPH